jgi:tetratricopeptide (TPR) repeat protein
MVVDTTLTIHILYETCKLAYKSKASDVLQNVSDVIQQVFEELSSSSNKQQDKIDISTSYDTWKQHIIEIKYRLWDALAELERQVNSDANSLHLARAFIAYEFSNYLNNALLDNGSNYDEEYIVSNVRENVTVSIQQINDLLNDINERDYTFASLIHYLQGLNYKVLYDSGDLTSVENALKELEYVLENDPNFTQLYLPLIDLYKDEKQEDKLMNLIDQALQTSMDDRNKSLLLQLKAVEEFKHNDTVQAVEDFKEALRANMKMGGDQQVLADI